MACPPHPLRPTLRRSLALLLREWRSRRAANDNAPFEWVAWQPVTAERAARYRAAITRAAAE